MVLAQTDSDTDRYRNSRSSGGIALPVHVGEMVPCWTAAMGKYVVCSKALVGFLVILTAAPNLTKTSHCGVQPCRGIKKEPSIHRIPGQLVSEQHLICAGLTRKPFSLSPRMSNLRRPQGVVARSNFLSTQRICI